MKFTKYLLPVFYLYCSLCLSSCTPTPEEEMSYFFHRLYLKLIGNNCLITAENKKRAEKIAYIEVREGGEQKLIPYCLVARQEKIILGMALNKEGCFQKKLIKHLFEGVGPFHHLEWVKDQKLQFWKWSFQFNKKKYLFTFPLSLSLLSSEKSILLNEDEVLKEGQLCYSITSLGKDETKNNCHLCPSSFYPILTNKGRSFYCGQNQCGKRQKPACIRSLYEGDSPHIICIQNSPWGFCEEGLTPVCNNLGHLLCL